MTITLQNTEKGQCYAVTFDRYRQQVVDKLKSSVSIRWWDKQTGAWMIPATNKCKAELDQLTYYVRHFEPVQWGTVSQSQAEEDIAFQIPDMPELEGDHGLKVQPYPYQLQGIARGLQLKRFINGDDMGLGKTLESIATINKAGAFPCLVICPNVVKINWQREWHKFTDKKAMVLTDSVRDSWPFFWQTGMNQVFIVNYESLRKYFVRRITKAEKWTLKDVEFHNTIKLFKSVIIDESHKVKSTATQQTKFCKGIATGKEYIILLTGTPVVNKPKDLVAQLGIMDRMIDMGGWKGFMLRYCSGPNQASNLKELNYKLWQHCFFRREKSKVLTQLPDKVRQIVTCEITNRKEYLDAERDLIDYLKRYKEVDDEKIQKSLKGEVMVRIGILKDITARGKLKEVIDFVKDFRENGKKIILFCNLHEIVDRLLVAFPSAVCVTGRQDMQEKQASVDAFQKNPKTDVIICSIKAASAGITLTAASDVAFIELPWTYADCDQAESRAHRIGQKDSVNCYYLLGRRTIDQKLYRIIEEKKHISNAVLGAEDNIQTNIVDMMANLFDTNEEEE
ncbi:DEAD/DEAH box helicase [uncultured Parabacteroides sp.]|uniref:DEAD/DEAH box helicase n=1 Tax=uncultured Parabacteroides sp. TaxID=512312 RepID=UPI0020508234|nr:DEAD/DEAH box helicase [uncultured Parabacteroides sp.]DAJ56799.1 MAG TPA: Chromatin remodeling complex ATPase [Caudoviricetes sp.]